MSHYNSPACNNFQLASLVHVCVKLHLSGIVGSCLATYNNLGKCIMKFVFKSKFVGSQKFQPLEFSGYTVQKQCSHAYMSLL